MAENYKGSCLCGGVKFEIQGEFGQFFFCHCRHCRKGSGTAHGANLFSQGGEVNWKEGAKNVKQYNLPNTKHTRAFCQNCGSALPVAQPNMPFIVVPAGSLDSDCNVKPTAHIFCNSKANWDFELNKVKEYPEFPSTK